MRKWKWILVAIMLVVLMPMLSGCLNKPATEAAGQDGEAKKVRLLEVGEKSLGKPIFLPAETKPALQAELVAEIAGTIAERKVTVGQKVTKGDVLIILEQRELALAAERAKINRDKAELQRQKALGDQELTITSLNHQLKNMKLQYEVVKRDYQRLELLYNSGAIPLADLDRAADSMKKIEWELELLTEQLAKANRQEQLELLDVQLAEAKLAYSEVVLQLEKLTIVAPISGTVVEVKVNAGQRVTPGHSLVRIEQQQPIYIKALLTEQDLAAVGEREEFAVYFPALSTTVQGQVNYIAPSQKQSGSGFELELAVDNSSEKIRPGMSAQVVLDDQLAKAVVAIPHSAVIQNNGHPYVFVIIDGLAWKRELLLGRKYENDVEVISGINPGEAIVVVGQSLITADGTPVETIN